MILVVRAAGSYHGRVPQIHPSAIVGPEVQLADDVVVGPGCIFDGPVTVGPGCSFVAACYLKGPLTLGTGNRCYPQVVLGYEPQDRSFPPDHPGAGTIIGDDNIFREGVTVHRATRDQPTRIGHHNYLMVNSHVAHDVQIGNRCTLANGVLLAGHVHVGDQVILGGNAAVHQFCHIGRLAMWSGLVGLSQDVPPFCTVYPTGVIGSLNLVGLRRSGLRDHVKPLKRAFDIAFRRRLSNAAVAQTIEHELGDDPLCLEFARAFRDTKRGISYGPLAAASATH